MFNEYGVPIEQNTFFLILIGECVHTWVRPDINFSLSAWECKTCNKSYGDIRHERPYNPPLPTVGDGHAMNLGELVRLWKRVCGPDWYRGEASLPIRYCTRFEGKEVNKWTYSINGIRGYADTPEAALANVMFYELTLWVLPLKGESHE